MTRDEGDRVAAMVLTLVQEIARTRPRVPKPEPTGIFVPADVEKHVRKRSA